MKIRTKMIKSLIVLTFIISLSPSLFAGNKKIMTVQAAKVIAERALVESVYGLKLRATESVIDMVAASFQANTESKTSAMINGIKFEDVNYDEKTDIAQVTATVSLESIENIDGNVLDLRNKVFRRVGFATSTPSMAGQLKALRAAELDAYMRLIKRVVGFKLESETTVNNFILTSDVVKTKVMATLSLAELVKYDWDELGDASVVMSINVKDASDILGVNIVETDEFIVVEGQGALQDDFKLAAEQ
ncbi:MAG: hypothetical protein HON76_14845 [Candidatus Scalindua sp.]|jgi:hypothetical protein|nr:hypothetical protein [Candidatus Scalindua sp.]MBT5304311.1 hypothetical protein [Candidatus Scalindua sp.]MBT6045230.1 hypothetical protein [Candidatus Scalindua sp.]MBT6231019.1 hypothetical protein [Candidatus Scalindua sp.]MBT6563796.1 hypothetical protein [Candidatus Scalindua sp.]